MTDPTTSGGPAGLADRVNQIHVPEPNADRERMMLIGGGVLVGIGIIAVLVGYIGASGTSNVYEQVPYALSGGVLGLSLIIIGCALIIRFSLARLFRFWLARIVHEHQVQTDRTVDALGRIETVLAGGSLPAAPSAPPVDVTSSDGSDSGEPHRVRREPLRAEPLEK
ncbi:MAG TPA: hypothetical protein VK507_14405 [Iamia sp.]|nr:hypothetical protein [Iamia sp.]